MPTLHVQGMSCNHCTRAVTKALESFSGVTSVDVDLQKGEATWTEETPIDIKEVKEALRKIGFEVH